MAKTKLIAPRELNRGVWKVGKHVFMGKGAKREAQIQADLENRARNPVQCRRGDIVEVWWCDSKPNLWLVTSVKKAYLYAVACVPSKYNNGEDTEEIEREQVLRVVENVKALKQ